MCPTDEVTQLLQRPAALRPAVQKTRLCRDMIRSTVLKSVWMRPPQGQDHTWNSCSIRTGQRQFVEKCYSGCVPQALGFSLLNSYFVCLTVHISNAVFINVCCNTIFGFTNDDQLMSSTNRTSTDSYVLSWLTLPYQSTAYESWQLDCSSARITSQLSFPFSLFRFLPSFSYSPLEVKATRSCSGKDCPLGCN